MKKITTAIIMLTVSGGMLFAQNGMKSESQASLTKMTAEDIHSTGATKEAAKNGTETPIFAEDFSSGIPTGWVNAGYDAFGNVLDSALWEYRGTSTSPDNTFGSRGAYASGDPIVSKTPGNGFVIFDSDYLDNNGVAGNFGLGKAPAPHVGTLTTPVINLTGKTNLELRFNVYHRYFEGRAVVAFSKDGGLTWPDTLAVAPTLAVNSATPNNAVVGMNISTILGNQSNCKVRFVFDGTYDDPGASGSGQGYYFWMLDDIEINELPRNELIFTDWNGAPAEDMIFGPASGSSKMGILAKNQSTDQTRTMEFDANAYNYGYGTQNNVKLSVDILDDNNTLISTYSSTGSVTLNPGDTANYNTLNTYGNPYKPTAIGNYKAIYKVSSDSTTVVSDTIRFYVTETLMSLDFNTFSNRLGTANLGDDGSAIASRLDFITMARMNGVQIGLSNTTVAGGIVEVEVYDTTGFDYTAGFPSSNLIGASSPYTITQADITAGYFDVPVSDGTNAYVDLTMPSYFVSVKMYSNTGANPVYLRNDASITQVAGGKIMYNTTDARWYSGYSNSKTLNSPHIRAILSTTIGVDEAALRANLSVGPNPADDFVNVTFNNVEGNYTLTMMDVTGRVVSNETINVLGQTQHTVDVSGLSAGVYMLNVNNGAASATYKISVQ